jgi:hypothetical protein
MAAGMPLRLELPGGILMFHGTPDRDGVYLLESVRASGVVSLVAADKIAARLGDVPQQLLLCGRTHIPRVVPVIRTDDCEFRQRGLRAYADDLPAPHVMQTRSPHARHSVRRAGRDRVGFRIGSTDSGE